jgi:hypothetical protein
VSNDGFDDGSNDINATNDGDDDDVQKNRL